MAITTGGPVKLYLEEPDGTVHELTGSMTEFEINQDIPVSDGLVSGYFPGGPNFLDDRVVMGIPTITATFTIVGDAYKIFMDKQWEMEVQNRNLAKEWMCDWCGSPNTWIDRHCDSCGGARSFIYD